MSENVVSFEAFETDAQIASHQKGLIRIILEGNTDVELFQRFWFLDRLDVFEFVEARSFVEGSGCTGVISGVAKCKQQGIPAMGILDRDILFRNKNWDLLFSLDANALNSDANAAGIYVASRWEVEAYLLEADSRLSDWVSVEYLPPPGPEHICKKALPAILQSCEDLLWTASFFASKHEAGQATNERMFYDRPLPEIQAACKAQQVTLNGVPKQVAARVEILVDAIRLAQPREDVDRLPFLLRYVDTKRLLKRLGHVLGIRDNFWFLASLMMRVGQRPAEFDQLLSKVETRFSN